MPVNKGRKKAANKPGKGIYAAVRAVQTTRSAKDISDGCNILLSKTGNRVSLFGKVTQLPVKGNITVPYGAFAEKTPTAKCATDSSCTDPMGSRSLTIQNYGCRFPVCSDAFEDSPDLEKFYHNAIKMSLERTIDSHIIHTANNATANGLVGVIGDSAATDAAAVARGSVAINNAVAGVVSIADINTMIACLDPYGYDFENLVLLLNPANWQSLVTTIQAGTCANRIDPAKRTIDGYQAFLSAAVPSGQAGVFAASQYLAGIRRNITLETCGDCDMTIKARARLAGGMASVGGGLETNTGTNVADEGKGIKLGQAGVYAAYLTGVANTVAAGGD